VIPSPFNLRRRRLRWNKFQKIWSAAKLNGEGGFPHSEIVGSKIAHISPTLIAACHVLHRLCMPRHPPNALTSRLRVHTTNDRPEGKPSSRIAMMRMISFSALLMRRPNHRWPKPTTIAPSRHRLKNPFTMSKCCANAQRQSANPATKVGNPCLHFWKRCHAIGGA
jgi:hypothetical protein